MVKNLITYIPDATNFLIQKAYEEDLGRPSDLKCPRLTKCNITLIERKSRVHQIQGVQGRSRNKLLRALGNAEDGVSSAFPACWVVAESEA